MMRKLAVVIGLGLALVAGGIALAAGSKCDSAITKAVGKKFACKCAVYAAAQGKGGSPDSAKLTKCTDKFTAACAKGKAKGDCSVQKETCANSESEVDTAVAEQCAASPSGAFIN